MSKWATRYRVPWSCTGSGGQEKQGWTSDPHPQGFLAAQIASSNLEDFWVQTDFLFKTAHCSLFLWVCVCVCAGVCIFPACGNVDKVTAKAFFPMTHAHSKVKRNLSLFIPLSFHLLLCFLSCPPSPILLPSPTPPSLSILLKMERGVSWWYPSNSSISHRSMM